MSARTRHAAGTEGDEVARREAGIDEAVAETFPASDPPAATPIVGTGGRGSATAERPRRSTMTQPTPQSPDREHEEELVDETIDESFPASDPPSTTPLTGVGTKPDGAPPRGGDAPGPDGEPARSSSDDERRRGGDQPTG